VIVQHDLNELYNTQLDGFYFAGVKDMHVQAIGATILLSPSFANFKWEQYINSGVLVMNLDLMRRDNLVNRLIATVKHGIDGQKSFKWPDQDAINLVCNGKIKHLPARFNLILWESELALIAKSIKSIELEKTLKVLFGCDQLEYEQFQAACDDPCIIHFTGSGRPWTNSSMMFAEEWWKYAKMSPFHEEI
jgi:lipopolysaccharide biosynthesis glycosyltransferase